MTLHELKEKVIFYLRRLKLHLTYAAGRRKEHFGGATIQDFFSRGRVLLLTNNPTSPIQCSSEYDTLVEALYADVKTRMNIASECVFFSADSAVNSRLADQKNLSGSTWELPEVKDRLVGSIRLRKTLDLQSLHALANYLIPQIEQKIYGAPLHVEVATIYRHVPSVLPEYGSILWHSDNHFEEELKLMIYFNEVGPLQAPFEYLRHRETGATVYIPPSVPRKYPRGRVPLEVVEDYKSKGYESHLVVGPAHSALLFDEKIIHKGNYAKEGFRDVLVLQFRPTLKKTPPYLNTAWTREF